MAPSLGIPPHRHYDPSDLEDAALRLEWAKFLFRAGFRLRFSQVKENAHTGKQAAGDKTNTTQHTHALRESIHHDWDEAPCRCCVLAVGCGVPVAQVAMQPAGRLVLRCVMSREQTQQHRKPACVRIRRVLSGRTHRVGSSSPAPEPCNSVGVVFLVLRAALADRSFASALFLSGRTQETTGTAVLLFHRFLIQERVGKHRRSRDVILTTCLFLAGKVTEAPRRLRDVINVLHMLTSTGQDEPPVLDKVGGACLLRDLSSEQQH